MTLLSDILTEIITQFPDLEFCELLKKDEKKAPEHSPEANKWIDWFYGYSEEFDWLRVKLTNQGNLIFRQLSSEYYIVAHNKQDNLTLLIQHLKGIVLQESVKQEAPPKAKEVLLEPERQDADLRIKEAERIQKLIIPRHETIRQKFKNFFVVHKQQDVVGGDFYWFYETPSCSLLALVDCTGHSVEGAMTSMVCNSLLNQSVAALDAKNLKAFIVQFYELLNRYNHSSRDADDYGIGAEMGLICFDYSEKSIHFTSTGISAFLKKNHEIELLKIRKVKDFSNVTEESLKQIDLPMEDVQGFYTFTDGLTDQYDAKDKKKLGYKGVKSLIEQEAEFNNQYYLSAIQSWMGDNIQYDDITLMGFAL